MNKLITLCAMGSLLMAGFTSCDNDNDLDSKSIFAQDSLTVKKNKFDAWISQNYVSDYNVNLLYRYEDIETNHDYTLAPADMEKAEKLAKIVKYCWLEAYDAVAGINFTRTYVPKTLQMIGSGAYESNGTVVLGTAEGGMKVTLYFVNELAMDADFLNEYYFKTMHHEFAHILHQTKNYDPAYDRITESDYVQGDWYQIGEEEALSKGFITPYAMSEPREDIAEMTAMYIVTAPSEWEARLEAAGEGRAKIEQKLGIVKKYMQDSWNINLDDLRDEVQSRMANVVNGKLDLDGFVESLK